MSTGRRGARWIAAVLAAALVGSAVVVYLLIRVTAPAAGGDTGLTTTSTDPAGSPSARPDPLAQTTSAPSTAMSPPAATDQAEVSTVRRSSGSGGQSEDSSVPTTSAPGIATSDPATSTADPSWPSSTATSAPSSLLPGSAVPVPAAWSGTATVDITVTGTCPGGAPSRYSVPADIALDIAGGGASGTRTTAVGTADPDVAPTLTIGVNAAATPSVAVYSASVDNSGTFHRFWALTLAAAGTRTAISGTVVDDNALAGDNPNVLVDAVQSPAGCGSAPVTGLPRVLAVGSTLNGWVDANAAEFTLKAATTDGQRSITITVTAIRRH